MEDAVFPISENVQTTDAVEPVQPISSIHPTNTGGSQPVPDTVQLSETAQVVTLQQQGLSVSEIAQELGIMPTEVQNDLGEVQLALAAQNATTAQGAAASPYTVSAGA